MGKIPGDIAFLAILGSVPVQYGTAFVFGHMAIFSTRSKQHVTLTCILLGLLPYYFQPGFVRCGRVVLAFTLHAMFQVLEIGRAHV